MSASSFDQLLSRIVPERGSWRMRVPVELGTVFATEVDLVFQTGPTHEADPSPVPRDSELDLARSIYPISIHSLRRRSVSSEATTQNSQIPRFTLLGLMF